MSYRAVDIANYFITKGVETGRPVSNMKLQKLIYYAQGWYMALYNGQTLFEEDFKRWNFGPVCPPVYNKFKKCGASPITVGYPEAVPIFDPNLQAFLGKIWNLYGQYTAVQLSELSHKEDPWLNAEDFGLISKDSLRAYFLRERSKVPQAGT